MTVILFVVFFALLFLGVPVAFSLGGASMIYLLLSDIPLVVIPQKMYAGIDSFTLLCIPGFVLAGNLMNGGGITHRIIKFCNSLVGHIRGGLGLANIGSSMVFAGISGTALADTASIGGIMIPAMKKEGYDAPFSCAVTAASSTIGPIIPPSLPMIIAGTLTGISVSKMFLAGAIPGLLLGLGMAIVSYFISRKNNHPKGQKSTLRERCATFKEAFWAIMLTVIILFGILGGIFTPTEASIVAVLYAICVGMFIYRELSVRALPSILLDSIVATAAIMLLVGFANVFAWILTSQQVPQMIADALLSISTNKLIILLLINLLLLFVGSFMETIAALVILFPVLLKVVVPLDVDPIHFGIIMVLNLIIGLTTPPVGVCMFVASSIGKTPMVEVIKASVPFLLVSLFVLMLVTYIPAITLFLPSLLLG
ncbi:TRAP transporter large permease [Endozoicomonas elysicola]|uniref:TRAP transporter large permease protein n=1 Tax=Endozoicomonas elysicola TaxID=305900 RepID=A0A081KGY4_9GAMM|nr:TRAP transporter large permease [Endozoicomonas elysicola]KEI73410.1 C4-dicarboxylate ABC transporter permease [Endozoicomonas elysicola]